MPAEQWTSRATVDNVTRLRQQAVSFARGQKVEEPPIGDLALALGEAINNAVVHAFRHGRPGTLTVSLSVDPSANEITATVTDDGIGFRPNPESPGLGMGVPIITAIADTMAIRPASGGRGTEICMTFKLPIASGT